MGSGRGQRRVDLRLAMVVAPSASVATDGIDELLWRWSQECRRGSVVSQSVVKVTSDLVESAV